MASKHTFEQWERDDVSNIMEMCNHIERSYSKLPEDVRKTLPPAYYSFKGFDENDPSESRYNQISRNGRRYGNSSHQIMMPIYRKMLERYTSEMKAKEFLTVEDILKLVG